MIALNGIAGGSVRYEDAMAVVAANDVICNDGRMGMGQENSKTTVAAGVPCVGPTAGQVVVADGDRIGIDYHHSVFNVPDPDVFHAGLVTPRAKDQPRIVLDDRTGGSHNPDVCPPFRPI